MICIDKRTKKKQIDPAQLFNIFNIDKTMYGNFNCTPPMLKQSRSNNIGIFVSSAFFRNDIRDWIGSACIQCHLNLLQISNQFEIANSKVRSICNMNHFKLFKWIMENNQTHTPTHSHTTTYTHADIIAKGQNGHWQLHFGSIKLGQKNK